MLTKKGKVIRLAFYLICASAFMEINAAAYIDPATTSYVIQIVAGIVIACGTGIGILWSKIRRKISKKNGEEAPKPANLKTDADGQGTVVTADDLLSDDEES